MQESTLSRHFIKRQLFFSPFSCPPPPTAGLYPFPFLRLHPLPAFPPFGAFFFPPLTLILPEPRFLPFYYPHPFFPSSSPSSSFSPPSLFSPANHSVPSLRLCVEIRLQQWTLRVMVMECIGGASSFLSPTCMQNHPDGASLAPVYITKRGCGHHGNTIAPP